MTPPRVDEQAARDRANTVLEAMSQDSGPADCEPYTGWAVDLARDVIALLDRPDPAIEQAAEKVRAERLAILLDLIAFDSLEMSMSSLRAHRAYNETQQVSAWFLELGDTLDSLAAELVSLKDALERAQETAAYVAWSLQREYADPVPGVNGRLIHIRDRALNVTGLSLDEQATLVNAKTYPAAAREALGRQA